MAKALYVGVNGTAKKAKKLYVGYGNIARKVKKIYVGDASGKARLAWSGGGASQRMLFYKRSQTIMDSSEEIPNTFNEISNPFGTNEPWLLYDKYNERFVALNKSAWTSSSSTDASRAVYIMPANGNTWTQVGSLPSGKYWNFNNTTRKPVVTESGILLPIKYDDSETTTMSAALMTIDNNAITLVYSKNLSVKSYTRLYSQFAKVDNYYTIVTSESQSNNPCYLYVSYVSDFQNGAWTKKQVAYNYYGFYCGLWLDRNAICKYNSKYYLFADGFSSGQTESRTLHIISGTDFSNMTQVQTINYAGSTTSSQKNLSEPVMMYKDGKAYINNPYITGYTVFPTKGMYSVNLSTYAVTKEASSYAGPTDGSWAQMRQAGYFAFDYNGTYWYIFGPTDTSSRLTKSVFLYYSTDFLTWTAIDYRNQLGTLSNSGEIGFALVSE